ncbi:hypothetical protein TH66_00045 [Carbonactinospora thermoautotrophica]|uniref:Uncharacterized protein n=1 Tax=Carbonactinospora thermoautotrophica TaxID=1469144 RepID=A0A132N3Y3_9ACTN|nr:hypothetical protein [Carbonactinospora thermoautotrophica]KWX04747.1 hypothetical protein TH66_06025 [Carbonactinospora thermoautotrophica]KWX04750.1 hypothetical protein TH66_06045 [Carbonactinospora thermoautotrophica]KWX05651.1 hypothetical protein TH66_00870 [Carbonactinospora thermoautotrophica]KWX06128.1 hypothetical protein TH66_00045 [Carbonactinospora thermoautotrophica]KWX10986.1 hypothetical protein TR74_00395 [Carbonactinospora thermoautotrophica]
MVRRVDAGLAAALGTGLAIGQATARPKPAPPSVKPTAAPHIQPSAQRLTGQRKHPAPKRTRVSLPPGYDSCDRAYGEPGQCVPWRFPTGVADHCA